MKLTRWIGGKHKPVRVGVYERKGVYNKVYAKWTGSQWLKGSSLSPTDALDRPYEVVSNIQNLPWRGLAEKP